MHIQGRLIACEAEARRVTRQELDGSITVIASSFQGRQFNRPNDVVVKSDGAIYFPLPDRRLGVPFNQQFKHLARVAGVNGK